VSDLDLPRLLPGELAGLSAYEPPGGDYPVRLDANENPYPPDPVILDKLARALESVQVNRYPDPASLDLRKAFAGHFGCPVERVMAGNGSDELIGFLTWTLRGCEAGGKPSVLIPIPTFGMYSIAASAAGYDVHEIPFDSNLEPDMEKVLEVVREKAPNIVFLSNPNNPTGSFFSKEQIRAILNATDGLVVVDEAYGDFSGEKSWICEVESGGNLAVLRTLSKVGAAALRSGFLVAGEELLDEVDKIRFPFNVNGYTQVAGEVFLSNFERLHSGINEIVDQRERLSREMAGLGFTVFPSRANFLFIKCGGREKALWRFLQDRGIMVRFLARLSVAGDALRVTVGTPGENSLLVEKSREFLAEGGKDA